MQPVFTCPSCGMTINVDRLARIFKRVDEDFADLPQRSEGGRNAESATAGVSRSPNGSVVRKTFTDATYVTSGWVAELGAASTSAKTVPEPGEQTDERSRLTVGRTPPSGEIPLHHRHRR